MRVTGFKTLFLFSSPRSPDNAFVAGLSSCDDRGRDFREYNDIL